MLDNVVRKYVWPILGVLLVVFACIVIFRDLERPERSYLPWILLLVGLLMVSFDNTRTIADFALRLWKKYKGEKLDTKDDDELANQGVIAEDSEPPEADEWNRLLRPVLYQASHYTVPTYYLNVKLQVIDWNIAFELIFRDILGRIRNKHVNYFINELQNKNDVFDHAREFTRKVRDGYLALVDIEPLAYRGMKFVKVAALLSDTGGEATGWAVSLMPSEIDWPSFKGALFDKIREDKLWSVYAASYDRILTLFPPYLKLIDDVIAVVPEGGRSVLDLGAGTGNVTAALVQRENRVTAVENNLAMLEKLRRKNFDPLAVTIIKASADILDSLEPKLQGSFDAAVLVNMLYAVGDPLGCLQCVFRLLKPGGMLAFSTTHRETRLDPLLDRIKEHLKSIGRYDGLADDYERLREANKDLERTIALRHTRDDYRQWVRTAGFQIIKDVPSTYEGAVMLIHAVKPEA